MSQKRSAAEWAEVFEQWKMSGVSRRAFCAERQISHSSFGYWKARLERKQEEAVGLVRVAPQRLRTESPAGGMGVMVAGKYRVEVGTGFSAEVLMKLLDVLERRR